MKAMQMILRLLLPIAGIVLLGLWIVGGCSDSKMLGAGLICTSVSSILNLYYSRKHRKERDPHA